MQLIIYHHVLPAELQKVAECYEKTLLYSLWDGRPITNEISAVICRTSAIDILSSCESDIMKQIAYGCAIMHTKNKTMTHIVSIITYN
jgi:hypothetical protein